MLFLDLGAASGFGNPNHPFFLVLFASRLRAPESAGGWFWVFSLFRCAFSFDDIIIHSDEMLLRKKNLSIYVVY